MPESPYTQYRNYQFNGPNDSSDYNAMVEENYKDLVVLYNWLNQINETYGSTFRNTVYDMVGIKRKMDDLQSRIEALESDSVSGFISFNGANKTTIDTARFNDTDYQVVEVDRLSDSREYPGLFLPPSGTSSAFQSGIVLTGDNVFVPDSVEVNVVGQTGTADTVGSVIETTQPELSFGRRRGINWERNVIVGSPDSDGAVLTLYVSVPPDVSPNAKANYVWFDPYPLFSVDILEVAVSTKPGPVLAESDNYVPLNDAPLNAGDEGSIGFVAPGGWNGDADLLASKRLWFFDPREVTALKIKIRQRNYIVENGNYVYTYGANFLDLGYAKVLDTGKAIIRYSAPEGQTFDSIDNVIPQIYNVPAAYLPDVFSYRVIYETAEDSNTYTEDNVELSKKAWIEITLNRAEDGTIPVLSGVDVEAS